MGKSLYIENMTQKKTNSDMAHVVIPLHGPVVTPDIILELFKEYSLESSCFFHIDVAPNVSKPPIRGSVVACM